MSNPRFQFTHDAEQIVALLEQSGVPPAVIERFKPVLAERDRDVENAINEGLRKTASAADYGNGGTINSVTPTWSVLNDPVVVTIEKQLPTSRLEVDVSVAGQIGGAASTVHIGARYEPLDGSAAAVDAYLGQFPAAANQYVAYSVHQKIAEGAPPGTYLVRILACVAAGGQSFIASAAAVNSLRVAESVW